MSLGKNNAAGGGAALNFDVKAYATEEALLAATPKENTIGIITTTAINGWIFSATEPAAPVQGMVWITTGTSSGIEFNALKKNALQVYPLSATQCVDGAWVDVTAMSYQGGEWVDWIIYLFKDGNEYTDLTGGWTGDGYKINNTPMGGFTNDGEKLTCVGEMNVSYSGGGTANKINVTGKTVLYIRGISDKSDTEYKVGLFETKLLSSTPVAFAEVEQVSGEFEREVNLSGVSAGSYYVGIYFVGSVLEARLY